MRQYIPTGTELVASVDPGPLMISQRLEVFWGFVASMYIGNLMLLILNLPLVGVFVTVLRLPQHVLATLVLLLCLVGAFSLSNRDPSPRVVALVLGPMMEKTPRQALFLTRGSVVDPVARPLSATILILAAAALFGPPLVRLLRGDGSRRRYLSSSRSALSRRSGRCGRPRPPSSRGTPR